jgi:lysyl endopeptidase
MIAWVMPLLVLAAAALPAAAQPSARAQVRAEPEVQGPTLEVARARLATASPTRVRHVVLSEGFAVDRSKAMPSEVKPGVPLQVGFQRLVPPLQSARETQAELAWETRADGRAVAALAVTSPGAVAARMGLRIGSLPAGTVLRFYGASGTDAYEIGGEELARAAALETYWSPVVESPTVVMEVELPPGATPAAVRLSAPEISHLVASPATGLPMAKAAASCNVDVMCHQGAWSNESNAVARILFTREGSTYVCSGTLLADKDTSTSIPYFLTANHCVSTQAAASTVQSYWFYRSSACASATRGASRTVTGGATLLYNSVTTDTALLRLHGTPPEGATYAGWIVGGTPAAGAYVTGIHHPTGDLQKISFGNIRSYYTCVPSSGGNFTCNGDYSGNATFYSVGWREGTTESGSSGSGLFLDNGRYLIGQLYGGTGSCTEPGADYYGRFDVAYNAGMARWLAQAPQTPSAPTVTPAANFTDMWWNPSESGWGMAINQHDERLFAAWYVYDSAGRPTWLTMAGATWASPTRFTADIYATTGPDPTGAFDPNQVTRTRVGSGTLDFSAGDRGTFTYTVNGMGGSKAIQRQLFGPFEANAGPQYGDLWWNAAESGWGLSITQQYRTLFAVWFSYLPNRTSVWYVMSGGSWTAADTYEGTLYRTSASGFFGTGFNPGSVGHAAVGSLRLRFTGSGTATMSYTIDGVAGSKNITRQPF